MTEDERVTDSEHVPAAPAAEGSRAAGDEPGGGNEQRARPRLLPLFGAVSALATVSVGQPVLDLLARNPEFFVARDAPASDVVGLAVVVVLVLPAALSVVAWGMGFLHPRAGRAAAAVVVSVAAAPLFLRLLRDVGLVPGWAVVAAALLLGVGVAIALDRNDGLGPVLSFGIVLPLLLVGWFVFTSPVAALITPQRVELLPRRTVGAPTDVVFFIFDEFPLATVLDERGAVDRRAFPNFARLAATSTWFTGATTVHRATTQAVPAILDGRYPRKDVLPTASDRPENLFTLVGSDLRVVAEEAVGQMCPPQICTEDVAPAPGRIEALASDVGILTGHMFLPADLATELPPADEGWGFFGGADEPEGPRTRPPPGDARGEAWVDPGPGADAYMSEIAPSATPTLFFKHVLLPHTPWRYLPSGQEYPQELPVPGSRPIPGRHGSRWIDDPWLVAQGYQRHILQAMNVDRLVGEALDKLAETGLLDDSLVVVVSDHGAAFTPGRPRRGGGAGTQGEVGPVPLFVKLPGQTEPRVVDRAVQTIDVLPTVADVLDADPGWDLDGVSLLDEASYTHPSERPGVTRLARRFIPGTARLEEIVARKFALFGDRRGGIDPYLLAPDGTRPLLGGATPPESPEERGSATLENPAALRDVNAGGRLLPALLKGEVDLATEVTERPRLAVSLNGRVASVTLGYDRDGTTWRFQAMLPPSLFRDGANHVDVHLVGESNGRPSFYRLYPDL